MTDAPEQDDVPNEQHIEAAGDQMIKEADEKRPAEDWFNRALSPLVRAAAATSLRQFFPFTSMARFCFAETPYPFEGMRQAFVEFLPNVYRVFGHTPWSQEATGEPIRATTSANEAISELLRILGEQGDV